MRIHLKTTPHTEIVPYNYQQQLIGVLHKWLGKNDIHDQLSLYSFSWLMNGKGAGDKGLRFDTGATWFISFYDDVYLRKIVQTILEYPEMFAGMMVTDVTIQDNPDLSDKSEFRLGSPILVKRLLPDMKQEEHYTFKDKETCALMKETLVHKMSLAGLPEDKSLEIAFDLSYDNKKTKKVNIHGIGNMTSLCPVIIKGNPETKLFAWLCGLGNSTGSGFGSIY